MNTKTDSPIVDYGAFMTELLADVESVETLRAKVRPMLEDTESPDYIQPGTECTCRCGRELRDHLQDILDSDEFANRLLNPMPSGMMGMLMAALGGFPGGPGEDEEGGPGIRVIML